MKIRIFIFLLLFAGGEAPAQTTENNQLIIGKVDQIYSNILHEKRTIWISIPEGALNNREAGKKYPVIYLLDGNNHFATVTAMLKQLGAKNGNILPEMIVVGILNTARARDFTPTKSSFWIYGAPSPLENTGGGEQFVAFLEKELMPYIDSAYSTAPYRILVGHSLGGLATTNVLINHTRLFNAYIIIDPSMWYDNRKFLMQTKASLQEKRFVGTRLYLGIANSMQPGMDTVTVKKDTSVESFHTRSILLFKDFLQQNSSRNGLCFGYSYHADDTHMSVPLITIYNGLRFIFNYYPLAPGTEARFFDPNVADDPAPIFVAHFQKVSKRIGYWFLPPENLVNIFANSFLDYNLPKKAYSLYSLNLTNYPQSFDANDSMGDYYNSQNDSVKAIGYYEKALKIKMDTETMQKLNKLKNHKASPSD